MIILGEGTTKEAVTLRNNEVLPQDRHPYYFVMTCPGDGKVWYDSQADIDKLCDLAKKARAVIHKETYICATRELIEDYRE